MVAALSMALMLALVGVARGHEGHEPAGPEVEVVEISGLLDEIVVRLMADTLRSVDPTDTLAVVFQVNSAGAVVTDDRIVELADLIHTSTVPVSFWVGPSGSRAIGRVAQLAAVAHDIGIAPGARIGDLGDPVLPPDRYTVPFRPSEAGDLIVASVGYHEAVGRSLARPSPVLLEHLVGLTGFQVVNEGSSVEPLTRTRFGQLGPVDQFFHSVASPAIAYLLFLVGMGLLVFELYTAGVGVAGVVGATSLLLGGYGLAVLPARGWAVAVLVFAMVGYAVDVQTGVPRAWTAIGTVALVVGSLFLFDGTPLSWLSLVAGVLVTVVGMAGGMPAMIRTRFATPTIGREWIIGETGIAVDEIGPNGTVDVRGATWKARTNRATPIPAGDPIQVVSVDGLWLEVEPLEGAARDYRDRKAREKRP